MAGNCIIVEHDPWDMRLLSMYAERTGLHPLQAFDGSEAVALAGQSRPDVILLDADLPGALDSLGVIAVLRHDPMTRDIPLILALRPDRETTGALEDGTLYCLSMPPTYPEFLAAMVEAGICRPDTQP